MIWLFNSEDQTWHLWLVSMIENGDHAWCGLPKTGNCVWNGDPNVSTKCQTCLRNAATLPEPP